MNGRRCKALRRAFLAANGRAPRKARIEWHRAQFGLPILSTHPSEWRRLKKAHRRAAATSRTFDAERAVLAAHRLEVRRLQKREAPGKRRAA